MLTPRSYAVHAPALSLPEAAMLPALPKTETLPRNLVLPDRRTYYPMPSLEQTVDNLKRGSMAGRAVLTHIKSVPCRSVGRR